MEGALRNISTLIPVQNLRNVTEKSVDNVLESGSNSKLSDTPVKLLRKCLQNLFPAPYVVMSNESGENCSKSGSDAKMNSTCDDEALRKINQIIRISKGEDDPALNTTSCKASATEFVSNFSNFCQDIRSCMDEDDLSIGTTSAYTLGKKHINAASTSDDDE